MMNGMNQAWAMGLSWFIGLIAIAGIIWLIIIVMNQKNELNIRISKSPLDVLKKRYVRGKIGKKEFVKRRSAIL